MIIFDFVLLKPLVIISFLFSIIPVLAQKTVKDSLPFQPFIKDYEKLNKNGASREEIQKVTDAYVAFCLKQNNNYFLADALLKKAIVFYFDNKYDSATAYGKKAVQKASLHSNVAIEMRGYNILGAIDYNLGNLKSAEVNYLKRVKIATRIADSSSIYASYYNLGLVYLQQGEYLKSAVTNFKAIAYFEQQKDTFNLLSALELIGYCYQNLEDLPTSLKFYHKAASLAKYSKDKYQLTGILIDLHEVHKTLNNKDSAAHYIEKSIELSKKEKDEYHYTIGLNRKSTFLLGEKRPQEAVKLALEAMRTNLKSQRTLSLCDDYCALSEIYMALNKYDSAFHYAYKGYAISEEQKKALIKQRCAFILFKVFDSKKQSDSALKYFKEVSEIKDSLKKESQLRGISQREQWLEKQTQERLRKQEQVLAQEKIDRQKQINYIVGIASIILLVFLIISIINYRQKQKANLLISEQKKILEEKNKEVQDSINYASRIQRSIMPDENTLNTLYPNCAVLYLPRDVVSGDFYWINSLPNRKNITVYSVADCTGHGVPGAFMSLIGATLLNQTLTHPDVNTPADALQHLNVELPKNIKAMVQGETIKDGMEISMCLINYETLEMDFSGANNNLYIVRNGELLLFKGDKQPIGQGYKTDYKYTHHSIKLQKQDTIYLFTDGYPDQFGGAFGKKFMYKQLENILLKNASLPIESQKKLLLDTFNNWKGRLEQVDDVLLMIIKIENHATQNNSGLS